MSSLIFASSLSSSSSSDDDDDDDDDGGVIIFLRSLFVRDGLLLEDFLRERFIDFFFLDDVDDLLLVLLFESVLLDLDLVRLLRLDFLEAEICRRDLRLLLLAVVLLIFLWRERLSDCLLLLRRDLDHDVSESESVLDTSVVEDDDLLSSKSSSLSVESFLER